MEGLEDRRMLAAHIAVQGNGLTIAPGDTTPGTSDFTDFGNTASTAGTKTRTFTVRNTGDATLNLTGVNFGGVNPGDFTVTIPFGSTTVAAGGSTTFTVQFDPAASGLRYATLAVASDDPATPAYSFSVLGTADMVDVGTAGLRYVTLTPGSGRAAQNDDGLSVLYTGTLSDNTTVFDASSLHGNTPFDLALGAGQVIQGWDQGLVGARPGEVRLLVIPASLGYGNVAQGSIPANSMLLFTVNVQDVQAPDLDVIGTGNVHMISGDATPSTADGTDFGAVAVGQQQARSFTMVATNNGIVRFINGQPAITIAGANAGDFVMTQPANVNGNTQFTVTFKPTTTGVKTAVVSVWTTDPDESPFTFTVRGATPGAADVPTVSVGNASVSEGNVGGTQQLTFTVTLSAASTGPVTVDYVAAGVTAGAGFDFTPTQGTLTIPAGQTTGTITVPVTGDTTPEPDETLTLTLSNPTGATLASAQATGTIVNDDGDTGSGAGGGGAVGNLSVGNASVTEGDSGTRQLTFTVTLSAASASPVTVNYATADGTAAAGTDYTSATGTLTIPAGQTTGTITVDVTGDDVEEQDETLTLNLSGPTNATIAAGQATGTITNDDGPDLAAAVTFLKPAPKGLLTGGKGSARVQVSNLSGDPYNAFPKVRWYLSADTALDGGDVPLGSMARAARFKSSGRGSTVTWPVNFAIPAGTAAGNYYLLAKVDPDNENIESDETNNVGASTGTITVLPSVVDLQVGQNARAPRVTPGRRAVFPAFVTNKGTVPFAGDVVVRFTASSDGTPDASDIVLGTYTRRLTVRPNGRVAATLALTVPTDLAPGTYHVIAEVDPGSAVGESVESNNVSVSAWTFTV